MWLLGISLILVSTCFVYLLAGSYGRLPFRTLKAREAKDRIKEGLMLGPPPECPDALYELMLGCWKRNPDDRFSFRGACVWM